MSFSPLSVLNNLLEIYNVMITVTIMQSLVILIVKSLIFKRNYETKLLLILNYPQKMELQFVKKNF